MTSIVTDLLSEFHALDIKVWVDDSQLRYRAPKGRMTPELLAQLRACKDELIGYLGGARNPLASAPLLPAPADEPAQLSFGQERLWFLDRLSGGSAHYNLVSALRIEGRLDVNVLRATLALLVERHRARPAHALSGRGRRTR